MRVDLITALPRYVRAALDLTVVRRSGSVAEVHIHDLRSFAPQRQVDDYPYGGGGGMVLRPEPIYACMESLAGQPDEVIYLSPDGIPLTQELSNSLSMCDHLVLIAGHYKGVDQRVRDDLVTREISVGDYVVSGGELPALIVLDAVVRLVPGALGDAQSALDDSFQDGLLGAPSYTRPSEYRGMQVPEVLLSGDHQRISEWRERMRVERTAARRPDLLERAEL